MVSVFFFVFLFCCTCAQNNVHHFCPIRVSPKKPGTKTCIFSKTTLSYKNSGFRAKTHFAFFLWHTNLQLVNRVFWSCWKVDTLSKNYFIVFFETQCRKHSINNCLFDKKKEKFWERWWFCSNMAIFPSFTVKRAKKTRTTFCAPFWSFYVFFMFFESSFLIGKSPVSKVGTRYLSKIVATDQSRGYMALFICLFIKK